MSILQASRLADEPATRAYREADTICYTMSSGERNWPSCAPATAESGGRAMEPVGITATRIPARGRIGRQALTFARWAWIVVALLLVGNFVASIPVYYRTLRTVCTLSVFSSISYSHITIQTQQN